MNAPAEEARPIIFVHGLGTGPSAWQPQLVALSKERPVLAPALPGYAHTAGPFSLARARETLMTQLSEVEFEPGPVVLCGLSLGAIVALDFALHDPARVSSVVLCCGFARLPEDVRARQAELTATLRRLPADAAGDVISDLTPGVPDPYRTDAVRELDGLSPRDFACVIEQINEFDCTQQLVSLKMPAVVCCGELDAGNIPLSRDLADHLDTRLTLIPKAGHVANLDAPAAFTALLDNVA